MGSVILPLLCVSLWICSSMAGSHSGGRGNSCKSSGGKDERTYVFAFKEIGQALSFADGPNVNGSAVNIVLEICKRCKKKCEAALVSIPDAFSGDCSKVLDGRWYDAVFGRVDPAFPLSYLPSEIPIAQLTERIVISKPGNNYTVQDLQNSSNPFTVAYSTVGNFLECYVDNGYFFNETLAVPGAPVQDVYDIIGQKVLNEEVDIGVVTKSLITSPEQYDILVELDCSNTVSSTVGLVVRKDDEVFLEWFNSCVKEFVCSDDYEEFCEKQEEIFGLSITCLPPGQLGCPT